MEFQQILVYDSIGSPETENYTDNEPIGLFLHCLKLPLIVTVQHTQAKIMYSLLVIYVWMLASNVNGANGDSYLFFYFFRTLRTGTPARCFLL